MQVVPKYSDAFITCHSTYTVKWSKNGKPLPFNVHAYSNNTLWINHTNNENRGHYECQYEDVQGQKWHSFSLLKVLGESFFTHILL